MYIISLSEYLISWAAHVDFLTGVAFKRRYRMDVATFNNLEEKVAPHLPKADGDMARRNRKAGPVSHEVTLAITLRYLAGGAMEDLWLVYRPICKSRAYNALWDGIAAINKALARSS